MFKELNLNKLKKLNVVSLITININLFLVFILSLVTRIRLSGDIVTAILSLLNYIVLAFFIVFEVIKIKKTLLWKKWELYLVKSFLGILIIYFFIKIIGLVLTMLSVSGTYFSAILGILNSLMALNFINALLFMTLVAGMGWFIFKQFKNKKVVYDLSKNSEKSLDLVHAVYIAVIFGIMSTFALNKFIVASISFHNYIYIYNWGEITFVLALIITNVVYLVFNKNTLFDKQKINLEEMIN
ncbi:hypothetical protein [[Mycoplasma] gypis]|uniref:Uncharacterized protein n=1 Tax=[Mycoplasma] gypis TaxID=92404 RepID=A0ABZ2RTN9_9BACT|nr:hypothetical protein [[Mycoplasma] gypis]MBN0919228.1 hypothetical protein [[Mycoplasma] gypis]